MSDLAMLVQQVHACTVCAAHLPQGVRPIIQLDQSAKILIAGQAPGRKVHESGVPFDDASGDRLREWMGITKEVFYDAKKIAILPMGFCYPGSYKGRGKSGDLPPRPECAAKWREVLLESLNQIELVLVIGQYAQHYHLNNKLTVTACVKEWASYWPQQLPLPHPSPRNNIWLAKNPWFKTEVLPQLQRRVATILAT